MRRALLLAAAVAVGVAAMPDTQDFSQIERGRYLAGAADCAACHTAPGGQPFAGGRPIETPFGVVVAPNITPDRATGIGAWTDAQFVASLERGVGRGGKRLYPAMPYPYYTRATRSDDLAIRAWLATLPAVQNKVRSNRLPFPFDIRVSMAGWNTLFFKRGVFHPDASKPADWNRGAYLVTGLGHCGACHTPKNVLGGDDRARALQGARVQGWFAPNITGDVRRGIGGWSVADVVAYLQTGHNRFAAASGPMAEVVSLSSSQMNAGDLRAIATYLKAQPGQADRGKPADPHGKAMVAGAAIYADACSACHGPDGRGIAALFPALAGGASVQSRAPTSLIRVVLQGAKSVATDTQPTGAAMPAFGWMLSDAQVAAVATYIRNNWGNVAPAVSAAQVRRARASLAARAE